MATLEQIQARMKKLQAQAEKILAKRAQAAVDQIRTLMIKHGLTTEDIEARAKARREGTRKAANAAKGVTGKRVKVATKKGKLPPKYLNLKTGETWSGHARPPAWIKDVKDRSKFLIAGAVDSAASTVKAAVKGARGAKKAGRKAAAKKAVSAKTAPVKKAAKKATRKTAGRKAAAKKAPVASSAAA
ncbi:MULTISPECIES: H-NS histone family protein [Paraburkholderia]|uniref:H-NS histone family protein n=1 Tax=Paraburkholderia sp. CHISQ3 TaxID=2937435 RepID=UPI00225C3F76|nr:MULTISPECIES: H-NS histone family protein [Paraburkholderia]MCX4164201.1 H-NS histone family protein [Paraburkholderia megapolitana]MDN7159695.1 H-NS histone family protein [Paraburkholderia sp. CHISQ3]MDQ6496742.1 H-NS histone family protein [Paraburkholderia megapolitana]